MSNTIFTAKLRDNLQGIQLIRNQTNFIAFNDIIEVKGSGGNVISQPAIAGSSSAVIDRVITFEVTTPNNSSWSKVGFYYNTTSNKWEGLANTSAIPVAVNVPDLGASGDFNIIVKVSVGQASKDAGGTGGLIFASSTYITIPVEMVYDYEVGEGDGKPVIDLSYFNAEKDPVTNATIYSMELLQGIPTSFQMVASPEASYWRAEKLPVGLYLVEEPQFGSNIDGQYPGRVWGTPSSSGVFITTFQAGTTATSDDAFGKEVQVKITVLYNEDYVNGGGDSGGGGVVDDGRPVINLAFFKSETNGGQVVYYSEIKQGIDANIQITASNSPTSFSATNLPPGLSINTSTGLLQGSPTTLGMYIATFVATNGIGPSSPKSLRFDVIPNVITGPDGPIETSEDPIFLKNDGVDVFFDLQSRALALTLPKKETAIPSDTKVINGLQAERLLIKTGETLWLNVRFVKGTTPLDPVATGLRFGVAGKAGGSLLMQGDTFTKVGEGVGAYYRMRVTPIENEFDAIIDDYYDDDAVEQISAANENQPSSNGDIEGICEVALTTGSGSTIAQIKSDTLGVVLKRSIF
jgi:hypothetical protein